ncbi:hypothetical protein [Microcella sp.]|uniref:hypothetical protein n=1 Tax=Microcella sp. TaxID=1913979 RepID=UPI00391AB7B9
MKILSTSTLAPASALGLAVVLVAAGSSLASGHGVSTPLTHYVTFDNSGTPPQSWEWTVENNGSDGFGLDEAEFDGGTGDAFDDFGGFLVDGDPYISMHPEEDADAALLSEDENGDIHLEGYVAQLSGLDVSSTWTFFSETPIARSVATFTNPGDDDVEVVVDYIGNLGSDGRTQIVPGSHDGLFVTHDNDAGDPVITHAVAGPEYPAVVEWEAGQDDISARYPITVPAGATVHLLWFVEIRDWESANADISFEDALEVAIAGAEERYLAPSAALTAGDFDLDAVLNWSVQGDGDGDGGDGGGDGGDDDDDVDDVDDTRSDIETIIRPGYTG